MIGYWCESAVRLEQKGFVSTSCTDAEVEAHYPAVVVGGVILYEGAEQVFSFEHLAFDTPIRQSDGNAEHAIGCLSLNFQRLSLCL